MCPLFRDKVIELNWDYVSSPDTPIVYSWIKQDGSRMVTGTSENGSIAMRFTSCAILERERVTGSTIPMLIQLEGEVGGSIELLATPAGTFFTDEIYGYFTVGTPVMLNLTDDALQIEALETSCINGAFELD